MRSNPNPLISVLGLAAGVALLSIAHPAHADGCAQIKVRAVRPDQGVLMVAAYADAESFGKTPVAALQIQPTAPTLTFPLCGLTGRAVALTLFQDLNSNGKLDTNVLGIPAEPWGASGKPAAMSAPTWAATAVPLDGTPIVVNLSK